MDGLPHSSLFWISLKLYDWVNVDSYIAADEIYEFLKKYEI
jgi:hypothetical protein